MCGFEFIFLGPILMSCLILAQQAGLGLPGLSEQLAGDRGVYLLEEGTNIRN